MTTAADAEEGPGGRGGPREQVAALVGLLDRPLTSYYLVLGLSLIHI